MGTNANSDAPISALAAEYNFLKEHSIEKRTAQLVLKNIARIPELTLEQAATLCDVSVSTFSRFCKEMGYESYTAFRMKIRDALASYGYKPRIYHGAQTCSADNFMDVFSEAIQDNLTYFRAHFRKEDYIRLAEGLYRASHVYLHDTVYSTVRLSLQGDLAVTGKMVTFSPNIPQQRRDVLNAQDGALFILTYDGHVRSKEVFSTIKQLRAKNNSIEIALMTATRQMPCADDCDYVLEVGRGSTPLTDMMLRDLAFEYLSLVYRETFISGK